MSTQQQYDTTASILPFNNESKKCIELAGEDALEGANDSDQETGQSFQWPKIEHDLKGPVLPKECLTGISGDLVNLVTADSEAAPAAVLVTFLTWVGAQFGSKVYVAVGDSQHPPRLFSAIVGTTSRARKGTSASPIRALNTYCAKTLGLPTAAWNNGPLSTGEGLINAVRDPGRRKNKEGVFHDDPGVSDKKVFVMLSELSSAFTVQERGGNILDVILNEMWDTGTCEPTTKMDPIKTTDAHVCIVGHITKAALDRKLRKVAIYDGTANRWLWVCAARRKLVSSPKPTDTEQINAISRRIESVIEFSKTVGRVDLSDAAYSLWDAIYPEVTDDKEGAFGAIVSRAEAHILRLALIYALLDQSKVIGLSHLEAALTFWSYCEASAKYLFGAGESTTESKNAAKLLSFLGNETKSRTDIQNKCFKNNLPADQLTTLLDDLLEAKEIERLINPSGSPGKQREVYARAS